jgi:hypothetical protein
MSPVRVPGRRPPPLETWPSAPLPSRRTTSRCDHIMKYAEDVNESCETGEEDVIRQWRH